MRKVLYIHLIIGIALNFASANAFAQKTHVYISENVDFREGLGLFQKEKYGAAQKHFTKALESPGFKNSLERIDAEYYIALSAIKLFNKDGELYLTNFIKNYPESERVKTAYFELGRYNYHKQKHKKTLKWFEKVDPYDLTDTELAEFYFKRGYSYFQTEQYNLAKKDFYELKSNDNKYKGPAAYYFAHLSYKDKKYETALTEFLALQNDTNFGSIASLYIAQLYYLQHKYDKVIEYAPNLLDATNTKRSPELARIISESYFRTKQYKAAIPYYKQYEKAKGVLPREDNYQLGYIYYKTGYYEKSIEYFSNVTAEIENDSLAQNVSYHIGDCYLNLKDKRKALNAFGKAAKLAFDVDIQESALFNYAKLSYELAYNPYNEAIRAFKKYIKLFPNAGHTDEAYTYLVNAYITSKNYNAALASLDKIKVKTPELKTAYQRIAYYQGTYLYNNANYKKAITLFDKSQRYNFNKEIKASATYWKGESLYKLQDYRKAISAYKEYIAEPGRIQSNELTDAKYNLGYSYLNIKDYDNSLLWFRKFVTFDNKSSTKKINDAYNRIGDAYFMKRDFDNAIPYYTKSIEANVIESDYALYQRAMANGVLKKIELKIADLQAIVEQYPDAANIEKVKFELASTLLLHHDDDIALNQFLAFLDTYPNSSYTNKALNKIGLIYYNKSDDKNAFVYFDRLIKRDRNSTEANQAIGIVKDIYTAQGQIDKMERYLNSIGAQIPQAALDSITYDVAKTNYLEQDCKNAILNFKQYIDKFPNGIFITDAHFYKAECEYTADDHDEALESYEFVLQKNTNEHTEASLYQASKILFLKKEYASAANYFERMEGAAEHESNKTRAVIGSMRCHWLVQNYPSTIIYAKKVLELEKATPQLITEAHYNIAHSLFQQGKYDEAQQEFEIVSKTIQSEKSAEAAYYIAYIEHVNCNYTVCEKIVFNLINSDANSPYWITKALILLADNYVALEDNFQAKAILTSIVNDCDITELIKIAQSKLNAINEQEEADKKALEQEIKPAEIKLESESNEEYEPFLEPTILE